MNLFASTTQKSHMEHTAGTYELKVQVIRLMELKTFWAIGDTEEKMRAKNNFVYDRGKLWEWN